MLKFSKTYELSLHRDYCARWGLVEGTRELLQNALDSESPFEYSFGPDNLSIHSRFSKLTPQTLLLGRTSKADDKGAIGSFGEGYKIALLVLTRMGYPVIVRNGDRVWRPEFRRSNSFDGETLHIIDSAAPERTEGVSFEVSGLSGGDIDAIRASCLHMQNDIGETQSTECGRILLDRPGKLYVGGLFICDTSMKFGYDVHPKFIQLERDRQTVSGFDLAMLTKRMWFDTGRSEDVARFIADGIPDMEYANWCTPEVIKEEVFKVFNELNPGAIVATSRSEMATMIKAGMQNVVYVGGAYGEIVSSAPSYVASARQAIATPHDQLAAFFSAHRGDMRTSAIVDFKRLMAKATDWKL